MAEDGNLTNYDSILGRLVVDRGLATAEEVQVCLQRRSLADPETEDSQASLAALLLREGVITRSQFDRVRPELDAHQAGRQIPGYQILSKLGQGAMATVYKARQLSLDRIVAVKILPQKYSDNEDFIRRFYEEGKAAAKLNHPNIVAALEIGQAGEFHYFVMEFVDGGTVYDDITEKGAYSEADAIDIGMQVGQALAHAHEKGLIHRDVKPKNIMFTPTGVAKLADMGLARAVTDKEAAEAEQGKAFGTPYYISPEQIRGKLDVDFRADIYSLGATLYHMVTGQVPFDGPNPSAVMHKHLKSELIPPDHLNEALSKGVAEIIEVCMAKSPDQRYTDTEEMLADLEAVARGEPPLQARQRVDLATLASLDQPDGQTADIVALERGQLMADNPVFWFAVLGWGAAFLLLITLILFSLT